MAKITCERMNDLEPLFLRQLIFNLSIHSPRFNESIRKTTHDLVLFLQQRVPLLVKGQLLGGHLLVLLGRLLDDEDPDDPPQESDDAVKVEDCRPPKGGTGYRARERHPDDCADVRPGKGGSGQAAAFPNRSPL